MEDRQKILIVDDRVENLVALERTLAEVNSELVRATSGNEALAATLQHDFSLAIIDVTMPEMDGYELAELMQGDERTRLIPILFVTAVYQDETHIYRGYKSGGIDYLTKPFSPEILVGKVRGFLELGLYRQRLEDLVEIRTAELHEQEARLRDEKSKLEAIVERSIEGLLVLSLDGRILFVNRAAEKLFGARSAELVGCRFGRPVQSGRNEIGLLRTEGEPRIAEMRTTDVIWDEQKACLANLLDITGRLQAEAERQTLEEQLRQARKLEALGQLAGGVAHDFNNILTGVQGYVDLVLDDLDPESPIREDLRQVAELSQRATKLTNQLLSFGRRQSIQPVSLDLNQKIRDLVENMLSHTLGERIELELSLDDRLKRVQADPGQVNQIILNLAINARDAMPEGGVLRIATGPGPLDERGHRYVRLSVSDSGVGMEEETQERIFEPFFSTKERGKGTGLGLSTVYGIVKQHSGEIEVFSEPGKGTTIKVDLRQADEDSREPAEGEEEKGEPPLESSAAESVILVVEDEDSIRSTVERSLSRRGHRVLLAASYEEAMQLAEQAGGDLHLLLADVVLPGRSGPEIYLELKESLPDLPVLFMSGYPDDELGDHGIIDSETPFLQKPFTASSLARKVDRILSSS